MYVKFQTKFWQVLLGVVSKNCGPLRLWKSSETLQITDNIFKSEHVSTGGFSTVFKIAPTEHSKLQSCMEFSGLSNLEISLYLKLYSYLYLSDFLFVDLFVYVCSRICYLNLFIYLFPIFYGDINVYILYIYIYICIHINT